MGSMIILFFNEFESNNEAFRSFFAMGAKFESNQIILSPIRFSSNSPVFHHWIMSNWNHSSNLQGKVCRVARALLIQCSKPFLSSCRRKKQEKHRRIVLYLSLHSFNDGCVSLTNANAHGHQRITFICCI